MAYGAVDPIVQAPGGRAPIGVSRPVTAPIVRGNPGGRLPAPAGGGLTNYSNGALPSGTGNIVGRTAGGAYGNVLNNTRLQPALQGARGNPALQRAISAKAAAGPGTPLGPGASVLQRLNSLTAPQAAAFHAWIDHATGAAPGTSAADGARVNGGGGVGAPGGGGAGGGGGATPLMLPGVTEAGFQGARDRANENYLDAIRSNRLQYGLANNSYTSKLRDMATQNAEAWRTEPDQFTARGIFDSGIHNRNMDTLTTAQLRAHSDLMSQRAGALATIMDARNGIERSRADAIANIEAQRQTAAARMAVGSVR